MPIYDTTMEKTMSMMSKLAADREAGNADHMSIGMVEYEPAMEALLQKCHEIITKDGEVPHGIPPEDLTLVFTGVDAFLAAQCLNVVRITVRTARITAAAHIMGSVEEAHNTMNAIVQGEAEVITLEDAIANQ